MNARAFVSFAIFPDESRLALAAITAVGQILTDTAMETRLFHGANALVLLAIHAIESRRAVAKIGVTFFVARSLM